jgi:hypothetical protein
MDLHRSKPKAVIENNVKVLSELANAVTWRSFAHRPFPVGTACSEPHSMGTPAPSLRYIQMGKIK